MLEVSDGRGGGRLVLFVTKWKYQIQCGSQINILLRHHALCCDQSNLLSKVVRNYIRAETWFIVEDLLGIERLLTNGTCVNSVLG
jgi:hypothetical protein